MDQLESVPGFMAPVRRSLTEPMLMGGAPRSIAIVNGTLAAALSSILGVGTQIGASDNENGLIQALRQGPADTLNQAGQQVIGRSLNIQPTLTIRPGFQIRVLVNRDLVLEPYTESGGG